MAVGKRKTEPSNPSSAILPLSALLSFPALAPAEASVGARRFGVAVVAVTILNVYGVGTHYKRGWNFLAIAVDNFRIGKI